MVLTPPAPHPPLRRLLCGPSWSSVFLMTDHPAQCLSGLPSSTCAHWLSLSLRADSLGKSSLQPFHKIGPLPSTPLQAVCAGFNHSSDSISNCLLPYHLFPPEVTAPRPAPACRAHHVICSCYRQWDACWIVNEWESSCAFLKRTASSQEWLCYRRKGWCSLWSQYCPSHARAKDWLSRKNRGHGWLPMLGRDL
jgi:hypothetical protein